MTEADATKVVRNAEAVIGKTWCVLLLRAEYEGTHVKTFKRELDERVDLLTSTESIFVPGGFEPLKTDDKNFRNTIKFERLSSLYKILALITVPFVIFVEDL